MRKALMPETDIKGTSNRNVCGFGQFSIPIHICCTVGCDCCCEEKPTRSIKVHFVLCNDDLKGFVTGQIEDCKEIACKKWDMQHVEELQGPMWKVFSF